MLTNNVHGKMLGVLAIKKMAQTANPQRDASTRLETGSGTTSNPVHRWWPYKVAQPRWQTGWWFLVKLNGCPPESPAIPPLGTYSKEMKMSSTSRPAAALLLRAPNWAQPTCPSPGGYSSKVGNTAQQEESNSGPTPRRGRTSNVVCQRKKSDREDYGIGHPVLRDKRPRVP